MTISISSEYLLETNVNVRALAIAACFNLCQTQREQATVVRQALDDESRYVQTLGMYLWRRESELDEALVNPARIPPEFLSLLNAPDGSLPAIIQESNQFRISMKDLFGIEFDPALPLGQIFTDVGAASQLLLDANDAKETNANGLVVALDAFSRMLLVALLESEAEGNYEGYSLQELTSMVDDPAIETDRVGQLIVYSGRLPEQFSDKASVLSGNVRQAMPISKARRLIKDLSVFSAQILVNFHRKYDLSIPQSLRKRARMAEERGLVFISYAREDAEFAEELKQALDTSDIDTWMDTSDIPTGRKWDNRVQEGLNNSWAMVVVISPDAMDSENVKDEINYAENKSLPLIPLLYRDCDSSDILEQLYRLARNNWIEVNSDKTRAINQCTNAIYALSESRD